MNIEGLTASKKNLVYDLAVQCEELVILLQENQCTSVQRLVLSDYQLTGCSSSRKHGLATFVHERLKCTLYDQSSLTSEAEWLCVDVGGYNTVNIYKSPTICLQVSAFPVFPHPCLYSGEYNSQHVDWGYDASSAGEECLVGWASTNKFALFHNLKDAASFHSGRWNTSTNPDLAFVSIDLDSRLSDKRVLEKFPRSQHRPLLILYPGLLVLYQASKPEMRQNFRKTECNYDIAPANKLARTLPPLDLYQARQCFCNAINTAAKKCIPRANKIIIYHAGIPNAKTFTKHSCNTLKGMTLAELLRLCLPGFQGFTGNGGIDVPRLSRASTFPTRAG